ncbi:NAD-dependent epimerase/dehydratase family protein [Patescibacteria group bacterium]|nr:NAD-dependent epimerase/dehydratase family protein [Patescibacteria group bacterium]
MKVLVTGGAGFIGSHLVDALVKNKHTVTVVDDLSEGKKKYVNNKAYFIRKKIQHPSIVNVLSQRKITIVYHLAAQKNLQVSKLDPVADAEINIIGSLRLISGAKKYGIKKFIFYSTAAVYNPGHLPLSKETDQVMPVTPYGIAKRAAEQYLEHSGLKYTILRLPNVFGPRQDAGGEGGVVAVFCSAFAKKKPAYINNSGHQTRDFIYVADVVTGSLLAIKKGHNQIINISTGREVTINKLYDTCKQVSGTSINSKKGQRVKEQLRSALSNNLAKRALGWRPTTSFKDGIAKTYLWFGQNL